MVVQENGNLSDIVSNVLKELTAIIMSGEVRGFTSTMT